MTDLLKAQSKVMPNPVFYCIVNVLYVYTVYLLLLSAGEWGTFPDNTNKAVTLNAKDY